MKRFCLEVLFFSSIFTVVIVLLLVFLPINPDSFIREQQVKNQWMSNNIEPKRIILLGGSNVAFGYSCPIIEKGLNIRVYNNGLHAGLGMKMILDNCARYLNKGDILVCSPEYSQFFGDEYWGHQPLADLFYLDVNSYCSFLSVRQLRNIVEFTPMSISSRIKYSLQRCLANTDETVYKMSGFNDYGDLVGYRQMNNRSIPDTYLPLTDFNYEALRLFVKKINEIQSLGVCVVLLPPIVLSSYFCANKSNISLFESELSKSGYHFICPPESRVRPMDYFFDTAYHLNSKGAEDNSKQVVSLLLSYIFHY